MIKATVEQRFGPTTIQFSVTCDSPERVRQIAGKGARILSCTPTIPLCEESPKPAAPALDAA